MKIEIKYYDKGNEKKKKVDIKFVSNRAIREYNEKVVAKVVEVQESWDTVKESFDNILEENSVKSEGFKERIKEAKALVKEKKAELKTLKTGEFFDTRFKLIQMILKQNGIEDELLNSSIFWDEQVEPEELNRFFQVVIFKDVPKETKKKAGK